MTSTTTNSPLRKQAAASIDAAATEIQHAARQELETLRSSINARLTALEKALSREPDEPAFSSIIEKMCAVAEEHADAASTFTRAEAEAAAAGRLAAARVEAQSELDAANAASEAMRRELEQRLAKADAAAVETARVLADLRTRTDAARLEAEQRLAQSEAARLEGEQRLARSESERLEGEQRLAQSEAERLEAAVTMSETERAAAVARQDAEAAAALLEEARTQITGLESARGDLMLARDIAEAHLEGEIHHRNVIEAELQAAREKALHAKADADACRLELQRAAARIRAFEEQNPHLAGASAGATSSDAAAIVGQVRSALQKLTAAGTGRALLDAALESLSETFSRVALCAVAPQGCTVWGSRGFETPLESRKGVMPLAADSPMARALADWKPVAVHAGDGETLSGVSGSPIAYAIALPIVAQDRATVMLYAENPPDASSSDSRVAEKIAEVLVDHLAQRLRPRKAAAAAVVEPPAHVPARQARRVKLQEGTDVAVDGARGTLVDLSTRGAQVLSTRAVKPNSSVRLQVPTETGALSCEARVVWVLVEKRQDHKHALYRAGMQFTDIAAPEFEAFFSQHGVLDNAIRH